MSRATLATRIDAALAGLPVVSDLELVHSTARNLMLKRRRDGLSRDVQLCVESAARVLGVRDRLTADEFWGVVRRLQQSFPARVEVQRA